MNNTNINKNTGLILSVIVIVGTTFFMRASNNMASTTLPLLGKYIMGFTQFEVGILVSLMSLASFLTTAFLNVNLNSKERRIAYITSSAAYSLTFIGFWDSNNITIWLFAVLSGATLGLIMPNIITSAGLFEDAKTRERILSLYTITLSLSLVAGPAIESYLLKFLNLRTIFLVFTAFGLFTLLFSFYLKFPEESVHRDKISVFKNTGFRVALLNILTYNIPFSLIISFLGIYEREYFKVDFAEISLLFSLFFVSSFSSRLYLFIKPIKGISLGITFVVSVTLFGILLLIISKNLLLFGLALVILGIPHGLAYPLSVITLSRSFEPQHRNIANSYYFSSMMIIGIIVPTFGGLLIDYFGFEFVFYLLLVIILLILLPLSKELKKFTY